ncbi:MAG: biopolymer transporter ExbD [Candidatus Coatesbacteria bacterium]|nr:MAG: biopolymer transporter ExbD [Candidatus Coatesbacteria bacterium]
MAFTPKRGHIRKQKVDEELELVPFIDMLAVLIVFLLMTATVLQTAVIEISLPSSGISAGGKAPSSQSELNLSLIITDQGFRIGGAGAILPLIPKKSDGRYDLDRLEEDLIEVKKTYEDQTQIILISEPEVIYDDIIHIMDVCHKPEIGLTDIALSGSIQQ